MLFAILNFSTMSNRKAKVHVSSVNSVRGQPLAAKCAVNEEEVEFIVFGEMVSAWMLIRECLKLSDLFLISFFVSLSIFPSAPWKKHVHHESNLSFIFALTSHFVVRNTMILIWPYCQWTIGLYSGVTRMLLPTW